MSQIKEFISNKKNVLYHSTFSDFNKFDFSKIQHFGTKETAESRVDVKEQELINMGGYSRKDIDAKVNNAHMVVVEIEYNNPLRLSENRLGTWDAFDLRREIMDLHMETGIKGFTDRDIEEYEDDTTSLNGVLLADLDYEEYGGEDYDTDVKSYYFIRDWIKSKGYDAITYDNEFEGGGVSVIPLSESQVEIIDKYKIENRKKEPKETVNNTKQYKPI
jgi:hypothetical protein